MAQRLLRPTGKNDFFGWFFGRFRRSLSGSGGNAEKKERKY
jgi:hypothetical protein